MKITTSGETISVDSWHRNRFHAKANEISEVRVLADKALPKTLLDRLKYYLGNQVPGVALRAIVVWAGEKGVTLDAYYDEQFDTAVDWFIHQGWDMESAVAAAVKTPLVRVTVDRRR